MGEKNRMFDRLQDCLAQIRVITDFEPEVALVLGSGLGDFAETISRVSAVDYSSIRNFPVSTVSGHRGRYVFGYVGPVRVVIMEGRVHYYEGYSMEDVVLPVRLMGMMGAKKLVLTNAAGGINQDFSAGDLMMITDHISIQVPNPLIGPNIERLGCRFPDMTEIYSKRLSNLVRAAAGEEGIPLREGIYLQLTGPSYETPAEIRACRALGADAVGMSTTVEAIAAHHMGMEVCGLSCITNMAAGITRKKLDHSEVRQTADRVSENFTRLITRLILSMKEADCVSGRTLPHTFDN